ncbi:hypothetical protein K435DRAFT_276597 [Dendrothele bispora CBS 962.96]|uniref:Uncharacterized protein n=1 Tax=Dendrothele bispora (strain CBS 962.96) TaxID=1314807 RepID=A0A4S8LLT3_DENBC|nr:hypothetical protein K435DRAFT_276597 [Dendrothele bispora CBS 962.96]
MIICTYWFWDSMAVDFLCSAMLCRMNLVEAPGNSMAYLSPPQIVSLVIHDQVSKAKESAGEANAYSLLIGCSSDVSLSQLQPDNYRLSIFGLDGILDLLGHTLSVCSRSYWLFQTDEQKVGCVIISVAVVKKVHHQL